MAGVILSLALTVILTVVAPPASAADQGFVGPSYSGTTAPTGQKPQSKLWFHDGQWWGVLFDSVTGDYTIHRLAAGTQTWVNTGVLVDERNTASQDALWDGTRLYIASAGPSATSSQDSTRVYAFSYNTGTDTYTKDPGYPVTPVTGGMEAVVMDQDSLGQLWLTYTRSNAVWATHSTATGSWVAPYMVPVPGANNVTADDISAIVRFGGNKIGVLWGNQNHGAYYFAIHQDGDPDSAWVRETAYVVPEGADDHINIKSIDNDPAGRVFAAVKTSLDAASDPLNLVLVRSSNGTWDTDNVFGTKGDNHTRSIVVLDSQNQDVYAFSAAPCCSGGVIYMKKVSVQALLNGNPFQSGLGTPFISSAANPKINNPTSTKQSVTAASGLVVLAGDDSTKRYLHNSITIGGSAGAPQTQITSAPAANSASTTATFEFTSDQAGSTFTCALDGGAPESCSSPKQYSALAEGSHSFAVTASAAGQADPTPATHAWTISLSGPRIIASNGDATVVQGSATSNYGALTTLETDSSPAKQFLSRFVVDDVTGQITRATLRYYVTNGSNNGPKVYRTGGDWVESTVTWNTRPAVVGGAIADSGALATNAWAEFDVTSQVAANGVYSFSLVPDSSDGVVASSREGSNSPQLVLEVGPADVTPPETRIDSAPATSGSTIEISFSSDEPASTFACALDGAPATVCTSPVTYTALASGNHSFSVWATDAAGNTDPSPATHAWVADLTQPTVVTLTAVADARVEQADPAVNYGSAATLVADTSPLVESYLGFDVSPVNGTVVRAVLRLYVTNGTTNAPAVRRVAGSWAETTVTWNNRPAVDTPIMANLAGVPVDSWIEYDVTAGVQAATGQLHVALVPESSDGMVVASREAAANQPQLVVTTG